MSLYKELTNDYLKKAATDVLQIPSELKWMKEKILMVQSKNIVEIGSAFFGTIAHFFTIPTIKKLISVDMPNGNFGGSSIEFHTMCETESKQQAKDFGIEFYAVKGDSHENKSLQELENVLDGEMISTILIDGDHTWNQYINNGINGVAQDFIMYAPLVKENGLIFFHDIRQSQYHYRQGCFVDIFWNRMKTYFDYEENISSLEESVEKMPDSSPYGFGGIGLIHYTTENFKKFQKDFFKQQQPTVSIVIPAYNNSEFTKKCLDSILISEQFNSNSKIIEIFVHSNGSNDETQNILNEYNKKDSRIVPVISDHPMGFSRAINFVLPHTHGNYICLLNNDVEVNTNWLDLLIDPMINNLNIGISGPNWSNEKNYEKFILGYCQILRRTTLEKIGLLNESFNFGYHEDEEICKRIKNAGYTLYAHCQPTQEEGWETFVNFPINHFGGASYQKLSNIKEIQKHNHEKWDFYLQYHNKNFVLIADNNHEWVTKTITNLVAEDKNCLICIVCPTFNDSYDLFYKSSPEEIKLYYSNNVHIVPATLTENKIDNLKEIGKIFFGKDKNIFYVIES